MRGLIPLLLVVLLAAACAEVGRPPGGPVDDIPPELAASSPGSLATRVALDAPLEFEFSEKVDRRRFSRALVIVPDVPLKKPQFDGNKVRVQPEAGWPDSSAVVWMLLPTLPDKHGVASGSARNGAFTTGASLPPGSLRGQASLDTLIHVPEEGPDWSLLKARLTLDPLGESRQRRPWRFADGSADGSFQLDWLELPSGPFQLEVWLDRNGDGRRDEREAVARVDSLFIGAADTLVQVDAGLLRLVDLEAPVPVSFCVDARPAVVAADSAASAVADSVQLVLWTWPGDADQPARGALDSTGCLVVELDPGATRWGAWLDLNGDLRWSRAEGGMSEPFLEVDTLQVAPAVPQWLKVPVPTQRLDWGTLDSLSVPPVPREVWSESSS